MEFVVKPVMITELERVLRSGCLDWLSDDSLEENIPANTLDRFVVETPETPEASAPKAHALNRQEAAADAPAEEAQEEGGGRPKKRPSKKRSVSCRQDPSDRLQRSFISEVPDRTR